MAKTVEGPDFGPPSSMKDLPVLGGDLLAEAGGLRRAPCEKVGQVGYECMTELEFPNEKDAGKLGLKPGRIYLHKCVSPRSTDGDYVEVPTVSVAVEAAKDHCQCVKPALAASTASARKKCMRKK